MREAAAESAESRGPGRPARGNPGAHEAAAEPKTDETKPTSPTGARGSRQNRHPDLKLEPSPEPSQEAELRRSARLLRYVSPRVGRSRLGGVCRRGKPVGVPAAFSMQERTPQDQAEGLGVRDAGVERALDVPLPDAPAKAPSVNDGSVVPGKDHFAAALG